MVTTVAGKRLKLPQQQNLSRQHFGLESNIDFVVFVAKIIGFQKQDVAAPQARRT